MRRVPDWCDHASCGRDRDCNHDHDHRGADLLRLAEIVVAVVDFLLDTHHLVAGAQRLLVLLDAEHEVVVDVEDAADWHPRLGYNCLGRQQSSAALDPE